MFTQGKQSLPCALIISMYSEDDVSLHFSAPNCQGKVLAGLPSCRDNAELLQQTQVVSVGPFFIGHLAKGTFCGGP